MNERLFTVDKHIDTIYLAVSRRVKSTISRTVTCKSFFIHIGIQYKCDEGLALISCHAYASLVYIHLSNMYRIVGRGGRRNGIGGARKRWRGGRINIINPKDLYITIIGVSLNKPRLVL